VEGVFDIVDVRTLWIASEVLDSAGEVRAAEAGYVTALGNCISISAEKRDILCTNGKQI